LQKELFGAWLLLGTDDFNKNGSRPRHLIQIVYMPTISVKFTGRGRNGYLKKAEIFATIIVSMNKNKEKLLLPAAGKK
jgi:hypothetical protein